MSHRPVLVQFVAVAAMSGSSIALAQSSTVGPPPTPLDPVVVSASRSPQPLRDALPATTVITRADIEDSQASDLATLLRGQAGIDIAQTGGLGSQTALFLRGANSNQTLVLIDGLRINAVGSGAASIAHLMIDQIDHIEIVRGNVSSLYGSEAVGGVIQIFTRGGSGKETGPSAGASTTWGSERTHSVAADVATAFGPHDAQTRVGVSASYRAAKGFSAIDADRVAAANPDDDGYRNASVSAHVAQSIGDHEIGVRYFEAHGHLEFDDATDYGFFGAPYDGRVQTHDERSRQTDATAYARVKPFSIWTVDLSAGQARDLSASSASYPLSFVVGTTTSTQRQYRLANTVKVDEHVGTWAYERLDQAGFSTSYGNGFDGASFSRHVDSFMAGYTGPLFLSSRWNEFQFNARLDRYSDFGDATTGLAAYGLKFAPGWKAIVQASNAFKAPTFNELYFPFFGNRDLKAERARTFEVGLQYAQDAVLARVSAFTTHTRDLIVFDSNLMLANNVARARVKGVEVTGRTVIDGWQLTANLTYAEPVDADTGQRLLRRATRNGDIAVAKSHGHWRFSGDVQAAGPRADTDVLTFARTGLGGYALVNVGLRYEAARGTTVGLGVTNALDRRYALVDGYNTSRRVSMLTVAARY